METACTRLTTKPPSYFHFQCRWLITCASTTQVHAVCAPQTQHYTHSRCNGSDEWYAFCYELKEITVFFVNFHLFNMNFTNSWKIWIFSWWFFSIWFENQCKAVCWTIQKDCAKKYWKIQRKLRSSHMRSIRNSCKTLKACVRFVLPRTHNSV